MLYGWMKSLIVYLILAAAVVNLSPSGSYKKYIKFFTGIVAIILLMKPISYIFNFDEGMIFSQMRDMSTFDLSGDNQSYDEIDDYYELSLSKAITYELNKRGFLVSEVSVITDKDNKILKCTVYVSSDSDIDASFEENEIKKYIFQVYNLDSDNINVVRR